MEHRWGERVGVDLPVRITLHPFHVRHGRLTNLSVSGAAISGDFTLRPLTRIEIFIEMPLRLRSEASSLAAYVTRGGRGNFGIEWCEFSPSVVSKLLATLATRPFVRRRRPESTTTLALSRLSPPLLKHAT